MATAYQPAKVVRVVCRDKRDDPVAILVTDPEAPTHRFHQVKDVVASAGSSIDWNKRLTGKLLSRSTGFGRRPPSAEPGRYESTHIPGLRFTDKRAQALLTARCVFRILPNGFTNRDLRTHLAPLLGKHIEDITNGQTAYDLRRLCAHGLITRIPRTHRYQVTDSGLRHALFLTRLLNRFLRPSLAELTDPAPPAPSRLRAVDRAYNTALNTLTQQAGLAA